MAKIEEFRELNKITFHLYRVCQKEWMYFKQPLCRNEGRCRVGGPTVGSAGECSFGW
jgi:hypothetical protein